MRHPKDKPHVERGVPYVRDRFFAGASFLDLADMRSGAERWCKDVAGSRLHGTTHRRPFQLFLEEEQSHLLPLGPGPYLVPQFATLKVHDDHHVEFASALYSVPYDLCPPGSELEVRGDRELVRFYLRGNLVKTHPRQSKGSRSTDPADYPPNKAAYASRSPEQLCRQAEALGPNVGEFARRLLADESPWTRLRQANRLLRLADRYTPARLEAACQHALTYDLVDVHRLERILVGALDQQAPALPTEAEDAQPHLPDAPLPARFARPGSAFARANTDSVTPGGK